MNESVVDVERVYIYTPDNINYYATPSLELASKRGVLCWIASEVHYTNK
jgi:hypothetical protein